MTTTLTPGWTTETATDMGRGQYVVRHNHPTGAIVDDNTHNDGGMTDLSPAELAETAFVGHRTGGEWEQFATFAEAAAYALARCACGQPTGDDPRRLDLCAGCVDSLDARTA